MSCRYDWHQTATKMTVVLYAKRYDPDTSFVEANPVKLKAHIVFPEVDGNFDLDIELRGVCIMYFMTPGVGKNSR